MHDKNELIDKLLDKIDELVAKVTHHDPKEQHDNDFYNHEEEGL